MSYWNRAFVIKKEKAKADPMKIIVQFFCFTPDFSYLCRQKSGIIMRYRSVLIFFESFFL